MDFYEHFAGEYDDVTGAAGRRAAAETLLAELHVRYRFQSVLDVACGNGMHAMMLARMGVSVTAADISAAMLDQARARAEAADLNVRWVHSPMQEIVNHVAGPFDAILCVGNSLPHLLEPHQLTCTLAGFAKRLAPDGVAVAGLLNFARVLARRERIVGITRTRPGVAAPDESAGRPGDCTEYVRFYDFLEDLVRFNLLKLTWTAGRCEHEIIDTLLRPYTPDEIAAGCRAAGLANVEFRTGPHLAHFDEDTADTVTILARR